MRRRAFLAIVPLCFLVPVTVGAAANDDPKPPAPAVHKDLNADEFERLAKEPDVVILDVRSPKEYEAGHLKNSVLINFNAKDFDEQIRKLDRAKTYAVYCAVGGRSAKACDKLDALTFPKVYNLTGGIKAWEKAGKPVEK
jgi:rhodanese-related sulfurtransferase